MTHEEVVKYLIPAASKVLNINTLNITVAVIREFEKFTGIRLWEKYASTPSARDKPMDQESRNLLIALAGPHSNAILKMHRIQKQHASAAEL